MALVLGPSSSSYSKIAGGSALVAPYDIVEVVVQMLPCEVKTPLCIHLHYGLTIGAASKSPTKVFSAAKDCANTFDGRLHLAAGVAGRLLSRHLTASVAQRTPSPLLLLQKGSQTQAYEGSCPSFPSYTEMSRHLTCCKEVFRRVTIF